jgi:signal transduction histidine kinase
MKSTNSLINQLLDIVYNLETSGNPHPDFLEATKIIAKNYNLSELFILIRRSFSGDKPEQLSYWLYSSKQSETPEEWKKHNIIEISYSESSVLKSIREKKDQVIFLNQDNHLSQMISNMKVVIGEKIDISSKYYGLSLNDSNDKEGFIVLKNDERVSLNNPEWISVKKILCLMIDKIFQAYDESNKIKKILSQTAFKLLDTQQHKNLEKEQDDVLQGVLDVTRRAIKAETGALFLVDSSGLSLVLERISSDTTLIYENIPQVPTYLIKDYDLNEKGTGVTPWVWFRKEPFNARDYYELTHNSEGHHKGNWDDLIYGGKNKAPDNFKCVYMTPLLANEECIGVLKYENRTKDALCEYFNQADERTIDVTAQFIANIIISQRIEKKRFDGALPEISSTLISTFGQPNFYDELLEKSKNLLGAQICSLFLIDKEQSLKLKAIVGVTKEIKSELFDMDFGYSNYNSELTKGLTPWILRQDKPFNVRTFKDLTVRSEGNHLGKWDKIVYRDKELTSLSLYSIPLRIGNEPLGVFKVENKITAPYYFTESDERLFDLIGRLVAIAVKYENIQYQLTNMARVADIGFLASGIAHEFNNYLQSFMAHIGLIKRKSFKSISKPINDLENGVDMAAIVIENFKDIRERKSEIITFDSEKLITELKALSNERFKTNKVELTYRNNLVDKNITINQADFQTIIVNLLSNAYESIREKNSSGEIILSMNETADNLIIQIEDSGVGINESDLNIIFSPFYSSRKKTKGMGVGLFWVQQIVFQNRGLIKVDGNNKKKGATFTVTLPKNN